MSEETRKVLEMLSNGKINVQEAEQLLQAVATPAAEVGRRTLQFPISSTPAREGKKAENVNIRVPMTVVRRAAAQRAFPGVLGKKIS
jgi:hypothetical protein